MTTTTPNERPAPGGLRERLTWMDRVNRTPGRPPDDHVALLDTLLEHLPAGYAFLDRELRYVRVNAVLAALNRRPADDHLGRTIHEVIPELAAALEADLRLVLDTGAPVLDREVSGAAGPGEPARHWAVSAYPVRSAGGEVLGVGVLLAETTERKRGEAAVWQAQKLEALGQFAGGVAHEFNNLLTVMGGYTDLLGGYVDPAGPGPGYLAQLRQAVSRAGQRTTQLLAFGRRQLAAPRRLDLGALVRDLTPQLRQALGLAVELRLELTDAAAAVYADPGQVQQVVHTLVQNGIDAMPGGGVLTVGADLLPPDPAAPGPAGSFVCLWVRDTGVGMTEDVKAHLFEPFFTTKGRARGTGLGLATVYGIVAQAGGRIAVASAPGQGTTFRVLLPLSASVPPGPLAAPAEEPAGRATVLLAEDESSVRSLVCTVLRANGYAVLEAGDGREALALWDRHGGAVDLVLTDLLMPHLGGTELAARLREQRPELPVIFMSAYTDDELVPEGLRAVGIPFLQKPFRPDALMEVLRQTLGR
jgi:signal transduction histidine kinase/CheY-like chemotaxis protein